MIDLVYTTSREGAESFSWLAPFAVISITDPGSVRAVLRQKNLIARCDLQFWDLPGEVTDGRQIFTPDLARIVLRFVGRDCGRAQLLLVHCEAGVSRSTAMANALGRILRIDVGHENAMFVNPNSRVTRIMREVAQTR